MSSFVTCLLVLVCLLLLPPYFQDLSAEAVRYPRPVPTVCPCAWLEKGGFWADRRYSPFNGVYRASRCSCPSDRRSCNSQWQYGPRTLTFRWIGMHDSRDYRYQMHFCDIVHPPTLRFCRFGEPTYELRQVGTWIILQQLYCQCLLRTTDVSSFSYPEAVRPTDRVFQGRFINMTCKQQPTCPRNNSVCYYEPVMSHNLLLRGEVKCVCPTGYFCPLYYIGGKREPLREHPHSFPYAYVVRCRPRWDGNMKKKNLQTRPPWMATRRLLNV